ncbi:MAG TPA: DUF4097 family beta strand repeat-containing protein [Thermoanaerobaculia bacterium]|nr:DUF4097 family beta strand repeat-containing protein [Thermoanaerobaculia bacterium]
MTRRLHRIALTAMILLASTATLAADTLVEKSDRTYPFSGQTFSLNNVNGSVKVGSWERPEVRIQAEKRVRSGDRQTAVEAMKALRVEVTNDRGGLHVKTHYPRKGNSSIALFDFFSGTKIDASVEYHITVPRGARVDIETVNAGIAVANVEGGFDLETVNGGIRIESGAGDLSASTVNGSIKAELLRTGSKAIELNTVNGSVQLSLPSTVRADLAVRTVNGRIRSELPLVTSESGKRILKGSFNGGGGFPIKVSTVNGSVTIDAN